MVVKIGEGALEDAPAAVDARVLGLGAAQRVRAHDGDDLRGGHAHAVGEERLHLRPVVVGAGQAVRVVAGRARVD